MSEAADAPVPADDAAAVRATPGGSSCRVCADTGLMRWQQPVPDPAGGGMVVREMSHPCTCEAARAAGLWRHPAAETDRVVDPAAPPEAGAAGARVGGQAAAAQRLQPGLAALLAAVDPRRFPA